MWVVVKGTKTAADCRRKVGCRGSFSHPARFELLEERVPFSVAPGTTEFGFQSPASGLIEQDGLFSLPGAASPTNGTNPANIALANVTGNEVPDTRITDSSTFNAGAINNPSFIPSDRPIPGWDLPPQVASTPYGIRNFEIGSNTSLNHRNSMLIGRITPTARATQDTKTAMNAAIGVPLGESLSLLDDENGFEKLALLAGRVANSSGQSQYQATAIGEESPSIPQGNQLLADTSPAVQMPVEPIHTPSVGPHLNESAVDQMMAGIDDNGSIPPPVFADTGQGETIGSQPTAGSAAHALVASIALGAVLAGQETKQRSVPMLRTRRRYD